MNVLLEQLNAAHIETALTLREALIALAVRDIQDQLAQVCYSMSTLILIFLFSLRCLF